MKVQQNLHQISIVINWKATTLAESAIIQLQRKTNMPWNTTCALKLCIAKKNMHTNIFCKQKQICARVSAPETCLIIYHVIIGTVKDRDHTCFPYLFSFHAFSHGNITLISC